MSARGPRWLGFFVIVAGLTVIASQVSSAITIVQEAIYPPPRRYHYYYDTSRFGSAIRLGGSRLTPADRTRTVAAIIVGVSGVVLGAAMLSSRRNSSAT